MNIMLKQKLKIVVLLSLFCIFLTACAISSPHYWPEKTSRVLELGTNKPLKDVYVLARWKGVTGIVGVRTVCYHVESTKTNEKGEFTIPSYTEGFGSVVRGSIYLSFYSPKHKKAGNQKIDTYYKHNDYFIEKFTGTSKERFSFITGRGRIPSCHEAGKSLRNTFAVNKAVYEEAKLLAKSKEEKKDLQWLRIIMASTIDENIVSLIGEEQEKRVDEVLREQEK